jgi:hypothetical protein
MSQEPTQVRPFRLNPAPIHVADKVLDDLGIQP